ncbi:MAG TPA: sensor histidine kinase [Methylophilus sp.]|uniref:sensor histidine kinase n=1 Tax=Methylophilus sp. TaxID=29541 RepID=UPI002CD6A3B9|nr:sensor histidine kinase [Methylophilus sp.]HSH86071.1 sensor histidine kinase [Methylophilus sp.]
MHSYNRSTPVVNVTHKFGKLKFGKLSRPAQDTLIVIAGVILTFVCSSEFDLAERINAWLLTYEYAQLDEIPLTLFVFVLFSVWFGQRRMREIHAEIQRRKQTELQLSNSQLLYKTLFDGDLTGNVVLDLNGNIGMHNRAFDRICRLLTTDSNARRLFAFDWAEFVIQLQHHQEINFSKLQIQRPDGLPCYVGARFVYVPAEENTQEKNSAAIHGYLVDMTEQCLVELDLERTLNENRILARHAMQVQEQERKYIASEIHDETGQYLTAIRMDALALQKSTPAQANVIAVRIASNTQHVQQSIRVLIKHLRPPALDSLGLIGAVERLINDWKKLNTQVECHVQLDTNEHALSEDINIVAFRVVQEALTNITRHAQASEIWIDIQVIKRQEVPMLQIEIRDNGKGMDTTQSTEGVGLVGMRERVESQHGSFKLMSGLDAGTLITGLIPLQGQRPPSSRPATLSSDSGVNEYATS